MKLSFLSFFARRFPSFTYYFCYMSFKWCINKNILHLQPWCPAPNRQLIRLHGMWCFGGAFSQCVDHDNKKKPVSKPVLTAILKPVKNRSSFKSFSHYFAQMIFSGSDQKDNANWRGNWKSCSSRASYYLKVNLPRLQNMGHSQLFANKADKRINLEFSRVRVLAFGYQIGSYQQWSSWISSQSRVWATYVPWLS